MPLEHGGYVPNALLGRLVGFRLYSVQFVMDYVQLRFDGLTEDMPVLNCDVLPELGFQPNETARALASGRPRAVDVIAITYGSGIGWLGTHPFFSRVLAGIMPVLEKVNAQLRLHAVGHENAAEAVEDIAANATLGVVLADITRNLASRLFSRCRRTVSMVPTATSVPGMQADNIGGASRVLLRGERQ